MASVRPEYEGVRVDAGRSNVLSGNALAVGSMLFWAAGFPAAEILLTEWHPIVLMTLRLGMALSVLIPLWVLLDGPRAVVRANWGRAVWIGMFGFGAGTNMLLFAQWYSDPVTVALIATITPLFATLVEVAHRQRRITTRFVLGMIASMFGGAVAVGGNISADVGWGVLLAVLSGVCFAWASHATVHALPNLSPIGRSASTFVGAAIFTFAIFVGAWMSDSIAVPDRISTTQFGLLAIYSIAAMALAQILFIASVGKLGVALSSFHINIAPFYVMIMLIALGGTWDWRAAIGAAIVGMGVLLSQSGRKA